MQVQSLVPQEEATRSGCCGMQLWVHAGCLRGTVGAVRCYANTVVGAGALCLLLFRVEAYSNLFL